MFRKLKIPSVLFLHVALFFGQSAFNQNAFANKDYLDYPELMVTPRATERLALEARDEFSQRWSTHLPIQASALATLTAGILQAEKPDGATGLKGSSGVAGILVGGGWLATTIYLAVKYRPYQDGFDEIRKYPAKDQRQLIARERLAEEKLEAPYRLGKKLMILSVLTNAATAGYLLSKVESSTTSQAVNIVAAAASFLPLIFQYHWRTVALKHRDYKKKIYGPVAMATVFQDQVRGTISPGLALQLKF